MIGHEKWNQPLKVALEIYLHLTAHNIVPKELDPMAEIPLNENGECDGRTPLDNLEGES